MANRGMCATAPACHRGSERLRLNVLMTFGCVDERFRNHMFRHKLYNAETVAHVFQRHEDTVEEAHSGNLRKSLVDPGLTYRRD
jgi:hypothetical protein